MPVESVTEFVFLKFLDSQQTPSYHEMRENRIEAKS